MKKSILALLLAVLMVASLLPAAALAVGPTENDVAAYTNKSGTTYYTTVGAAITAANKGGGGTIELLKNAELKASDVSYPYSYSDTYGKGTYVDKALILDLGGYTLTCNDYWGLDVTPYASLTVEHGTYEHKGGTSYGYTGTAIQANKVKEAGPGCTVTIESDATIKTDGDAVLCQGYNTVNVYGNIYCVSNGVFGMGPCNTVTLDGAYIESENYAVYQNPYSKTERKGSTYTIKDSTIIAGNDDPGVYLFNYTGIATSNHTLTIENSKISADIGVYLSCTDATIKGENTKIEYTNTAGNSVYFSHDGSATTPGGTVGSLTINGGEFVGPIGVEEPTGGAGNAAVISVNGGYFTEPVDVSYLSSEFKYMVHKDLYYSYYETLAEALQAAAPDGTVEAIAIPGRVIHTVTVVYGNGTADTVNTYVDGETINLPAAPTREGYAFLGWSDGAETYSPGDGYTVTKDTIITALWKEEYNVVYIYNNGAATGHETVLKGESVTLPTPSKSGYAFLGWTCSDGNVYDGGDSVVIWGNTTFEASWVRHPDTPYVPEPSEPVEPDVPSFPFYDVPTSAWYYTAVKYVYDNKLMDGVDTYTFAPNDTLTRAMVWTIIARMSGVDTTGGNSWYAKAQEWVITNGISDGENPTAAITRQELVTMLYRYAQIKGYDVSVGESTNILSYVDAASISEYAMSAFQWACGSGLTEGDENGALTPLATATRAQAAAMIMRFCESVK